jgi:hypothetical protein
MPHRAAQKLERAVQPLFCDCVVNAQVADFLGDVVRPEELEAAKLREHAVVRLDQNRGEYDTPAVSRPIVRHVVSEHGLARARRTADQVHPAGHEPTLGDRVKAGNTGVQLRGFNRRQAALRGRDRYSV